ncbi:cucumisin [Ziziphus jujuba]|uniref:Cucumisin n=1 Tax=Ziziphus jujuba TaxID=326968 RepID=A0A6P3ZNG1_ZIZJJ|nr:cucumisin [Ziziphus jujuba]
MAISWLFLFSLISTLLVTAHHSSANQHDRKVYVVYMGDMAKEEVSTSPLHLSMLEKVISSNDIVPAESLLHSYKRSFNGFAAKLTNEEADKISGMKGVVSVFKSRKMNFHTTKSWEFIGFPQHVKRTKIEGDIIVGVIDSGIWPESPSFDDKGFGPPPAKWKGTCQVSSNFTCNNKIIGAKYYKADGQFSEDDLQSPRDSDGHGTHTASTVAGGIVNKASQLGFGFGTARGGVPSARIAAYKVGWSDGIEEADILAAFDDAIADGVDIISTSIGTEEPQDYFMGGVVIGSFHAMRKGILTSTSAGNDGPGPFTITNFAPWLLSVAATTINREFLTKAWLGNNKIFEGNQINPFDLKNQTFPLVYGGSAPNSEYDSRECDINSLDKKLVKGKIVYCESDTKGQGPLLAGATGFLGKGRLFGGTSSNLPLPGSLLSYNEASEVYKYIKTNSKPIATISRSEEVADTRSPYIPNYSSRGPNPITPNILKPDIAAPGSLILAAWSPIAPSTELGVKGLRYNIISGTSMACPHATAVAAYIKSFHPTWSPAAIRSSLMTTAKPLSSKINPDAEFAYGSGLINPIKALYPGLVYDTDELDYVKFLCGEGYDKILQNITGNDKLKCTKGSSISATDLNYPSFALSTLPSQSITHVFYRTVTNVGSANSNYKAKVVAPQGMNVIVSPSVLSFTSIGQKLSFSVELKGKIDGIIASASLVWDDGTFQVRSPIVVCIAP